MEFFTAIVDAEAVCGVDYPNEGVCLLKVVAPVRA
jgi:hypothetical protein